MSVQVFIKNEDGTVRESLIAPSSVNNYRNNGWTVEDPAKIKHEPEAENKKFSEAEDLLKEAKDEGAGERFMSNLLKFVERKCT